MSTQRHGRIVASAMASLFAAITIRYARFGATIFAWARGTGRRARRSGPSAD